MVLIACAIGLTGCSTPAVEEKFVEVKVPVAVQPIKPEQVPVPPAPLPPPPATLSAMADVLLAQVCKLVEYVIKADPLLDVSAGLPPTQAPRYPECEDQ